MFHVFESIYFDFHHGISDHGYDRIVIGKSELFSAQDYASFTEFVEKELNGKPSDFWRFLRSYPRKSSRLIVYLEANQLLELQLELWKNILPHASNDTLVQLHKTYLEDCKFRRFLSTNVESEKSKQGYSMLKPFDTVTLEQVIQKISPIPFLKELKKEELSFEYQLSEFLLNPNSPIKACVLDKVRHFTWSNWLAELEILKGDILNGIIDVNRLLPDDSHIDVSDPTLLFHQIIGHPYLSWVTDLEFYSSNYDFIERSYDKNIFKKIYERFYSLWQVNGEDMSELIDLIYSHQYEKLLYRDIQRSFGCVYSAGRFRNRMNQILISWIYSMKRANNTAALKSLSLS
ncbi:MAG: hypothetical protein JNM24_15450 [Bdellovibrionaceae bacterium]|jgi:hypothetical protein|nr:hypothetical protein [Pseudobdellovibrionaceae bacterium]